MLPFIKDMNERMFIDGAFIIDRLKGEKRMGFEICVTQWLKFRCPEYNSSAKV